MEIKDRINGQGKANPLAVSPPHEGVFKNWKPSTNTNKQQQLQTQARVERANATISLMLSASSYKLPEQENSPLWVLGRQESHC